MVRNTLAAVLAALGAAAVIISPFLTWYTGREGQHFRWTELFTPNGITGNQAGLITGLFLPMLVVAVLAVLGALLRSRLLTLISAVLVLGFTILWLVRQYQVADSLTIGGGTGLVEGPALALLGGLLLLASTLLMAGRHLWARGRRDETETGRDHGRVRPGARDERGEVVEGPWRGGEEPPEHRRGAA